MRRPGRPLKKLPEGTIIRQIIRLRSRNNRQWAIVWKHGYKTRKGMKAWRKIQDNDFETTRWMSRI